MKLILKGMYIIDHEEKNLYLQNKGIENANVVIQHDDFPGISIIVGQQEYIHLDLRPFTKLTITNDLYVLNAEEMRNEIAGLW